MDNLQQIAIDRIVPSPEPVRSTWDEEKMAELVASVAENGVIVPIKVRPIDSGKLEIVYGHRRVEAARQVGFDAVPAVVETMTALDAFVQAGLENITRDDLTPAEEGAFYRNCLNMGMTRKQVADTVGIKTGWIDRCLNLVGDESMRVLTRVRGVPDAVHKAGWIKGAISDVDTRRAVAQKVVDEDLTSRQTKQLAEAIAKAPHEQARNMLLDMPFSPIVHHPEEVSRHDAHSPMWRTNEPTQQQQWDASPEVKTIVKGVLDTLAAVRKLMGEIGNVATTDKFSPEARQFVAERLRKFRTEIDHTISQLEAQDDCKWQHDQETFRGQRNHGIGNMDSELDAPNESLHR